MSDQSKGGQRVGSVMSQLAAFGYRNARISHSGQRRGARRDERGIDGDIIAFAPPEAGKPHLLVEVGGAKKSVFESLAEMRAEPLPPGFVAIVARCMPNRRWRWHFEAHERGVDTLQELFEALAER